MKSQNSRRAKRLSNGLSKGLRKVMAFGTFDLLHPGHRHFLGRAKELGDLLVVVVARDKTVREIKGSLPVHDEQERADNVRRLGFVDEVVLGSEGDDKFSVIRKVKPDVICLGYDQRSYTDGLENWLKDNGMQVKVVRLKPYKPHEYKTSIAKRRGKGKSY